MNKKNLESVNKEKKMKKIGILVIITTVCFLIVGCTNKQKNIEGKLTDLMNDVYAGLDDKLPKLSNTELTNDNLKYYLGLDKLDYIEGLASEPMIGSIAHSVVLVKVKDNVDIEKTKKEILEKVDSRKWICVEVPKEDIIVENKGNLIILIMVNENADQIQKNFKNLK